MVSLADLWLPIVLSAVLVFVASSLIHMVLGWHRHDFKKFAAEDAVMDALRPFNLGPGDYVAPLPDSRSLGYTIRTTIDGVLYALLTGGAFGWLWP
jgi:hypothetical protein